MIIFRIAATFVVQVKEMMLYLFVMDAMKGFAIMTAKAFQKFQKEIGSAIFAEITQT